jgi:Icc-related predicted phosphoesterase
MQPKPIQSTKNSSSILALADVHSDFDRFAVCTLPDADLVLIAGDLLEHGRHNHTDLKNCAAWLEELVGRYPFVGYVLGNHDLNITSEFDGIGGVNLHHHTHQFRHLHITGCRSVFMGGTFNRTETAYDNVDNSFDTASHSTTSLERDQREFSDLRGDVWVCHSPPKGVLDHAGRKSLGSPGLLAAITAQQPALVICGHVHESGGFEDAIGQTRICNVARGAYSLEFPTSLNRKKGEKATIR